jgi:histidine ammonia-lyase
MYDHFRREVSFMELDRYIAPDIEKSKNFIKNINIDELSTISTITL